MDPSVSVDLSSVAGIVAVTLTLVHLLKAPLGRMPALQEMPVALYVVVVSGVLTWLAHDVMHALDGDLKSLIVQAVMSALASSGAVEWWRAGSKPVADTTTSILSRRNDGLYVIPILLAVGLSVGGCAGKARGVVVQADATIATVLVTVQQGADALVKADCQPGQPCLTPAQRRELSPALLTALRLGLAANESISSQSAHQLVVGPMLEALRELQDAIARIVPAAVRPALMKDMDRALVLAAGGR